MKLKPNSVKGILKELVERCENCGNRNINISEYEFFEKKEKGFFDGWLVPSDPEKLREYERKKELDDKDGLEVIYYCNICGEYYKQFYNSKTLEIWLETFKNKYK